MNTEVKVNLNTNKHKFVNGNLLQLCPPDINENEWNLFIQEMENANNYQIQDNPVQIDLELNSDCNMACPFCRHGYEEVPKVYADINRYKKLINEAVQFGVKSLKLNYINEPLLNRDLEEIIAYAKASGILNVYLTTNGSLLIKSRRQKMLDSGITKIFISIDAATSETYSKQRLNGRFNSIVKNVIELIKDRNERGQQFPLIRVSFLENKLNYHEKADFKNFWEGVADLIAFQKMNEVPNTESGLILNPDHLPEDGCQFPFKQLVVDAEGDILPCCSMHGKSMPLGNIQNMTLKQAWNSPQMKELQDAHQTDRWKQIDICRECMAG
jgi:radical SAM protein with 4Fe4S-binding SPASM domain